MCIRHSLSSRYYQGRIVAGLLVATLFAGPASSAAAGIKAEPLPDGPGAGCELRTITPRKVVEVIYENVVRTSSASLDEMAKYVSPDIVFKDPVTSIRGWPAYRKVYEQFISADQLYYRILNWSCSGRTVYINWVFGMQNANTGGEYVEFEGVSKLVVDEQERIVLNLDNWNEIPPGYAGALRSGDKGGLELQ